MKYLSIDIESTGLEADSLIIEFGAAPFDTTKNDVTTTPFFHRYLSCPSFESLSPKLSSWVRENNEKLIRKAHSQGISIEQFKAELTQYLTSPEVREYFGNEKIVLFGKSLSAIDLPFLTRDLGFAFMRDQFSHRNLDLTSVAYSMTDAELIPAKAGTGSSSLMKYFGMGEVPHTALEDARNTAIMYCKLLSEVKKK